MNIRTKSEPFLTIIIPAYNEAERLPETLPQVLAFVDVQPYPIEVLVVDNNSSDRTSAVVQEIAQDHPTLELLHEPTQGKGAAVRRGVLAGRGEYLFFGDADLAMPIEEVSKFVPPALPGYDIAIASREAPGAVRYNEPWYRHLMGRVFNFVVRSLAVPGIQDTQCGFKSFRRDVAHDLFTAQTVNGWAFDVELLHIATRRGYEIVEVPVHWYYGVGSRVSPLRDSVRMFLEVLRIRRNGRAGLYDRPLDSQPE